MKRPIILLSLLLGSAVTLMAQALYPYQDPNLTPDERAADLVSRLTLEQKAALMVDESAAIPELGIRRYGWWSEALHGYARSGLATVFPQSIGMAASFDPELVERVFTAASDEGRAKHTLYEQSGGSSRYQGLTVWTPNINIFRDPRWGRGQETYGEDPYLTATMGLAVVRGLQGPEDSKYDKLHACAKHYAIHSGPEYKRHAFNAENISLRDLTETYLYAFERLVREGHVKEVMCAYNAFEGEPCCGSNTLLVQILRNQWGYDDVVVSDCGAIDDFYSKSYDNHRTHPDAASATADAVINGTDLNCGGTYRHIPEAVKRGLLTEEQVNKSVFRLLRARFQLGEMDPDSIVEWTKISPDVIACDEHDALAHQMARETIVLLQNKRGVLPLDASAYSGSRRLAVIGPNAADSLSHWGNYYGMARRTYSVLEGIRSKLGDPDAVFYNKVSELVNAETFQSRFGNCSTAAGKGFDAVYYGNVDLEGEPIATDHLSAPFQLCTSGNTVFAPGVPLEDFSARYITTYHADRTEEILFTLFVNGRGTVFVNGEPISRFSQGHGSRKADCKPVSVEKGKDYTIEILFSFFRADAQLNFDLGVKEPLSDEQLLANLEGIDDVIYVGGISPQLEGEEMRVDFEGFRGGDRTSIELPAVQRKTLATLRKAGKRVVYVNMSGSAIALEPETKSCDAIVQGWYNGQDGGLAIADVLFGDYNPAGRLPVTFHKSDAQLPDYEDYNMNAGHTYRYMTERPLFPFGYGLSYSTFKYGRAHWGGAEDSKRVGIGKLSLRLSKRFVALKGQLEKGIKLTVPVKNTSNYNGEEVVQLYVTKLGEKEGPCYALRGFKRVNLPAKSKESVTFTLTEKELCVYDNNVGALACTPGTYRIYYGPSSDKKKLKHVDVKVR